MDAPTAERPLHLSYPGVLNGLGDAAPGASVMHALSWSSGSVLVDAAIGGFAGYAVAPKTEKNSRWMWTAGGAVAAGVAGVFGLLVTVGYGYSLRRR